MKKIMQLLLVLALFVPSIVLADSNKLVTSVENNVSVVAKYKEKTTDKHIGENFCSENDVKSALKVLGYFVLIARIAVPILIIIFGSIDLAKATIKGEDKALGQQFKILGIRFFMGIMVFFIPGIIDAVFSAIEEYQNIESEYHDCETCLLRPNECETHDVSVVDDDV